jgi:phosphoribosylaminoimidazolecarboxamide formyltransferase/IMP cyclohydrolase
MQVKILLYGENAWQRPSRFEPDLDSADPLALGQFSLVAGNELSYNNYCDLDRMLQTMTHVAAGLATNKEQVPYIVIGAKHGNPCGIGVAFRAPAAICKMVEGDPIAIFGGLVLANYNLDEESADLLLSYGMEGKGRRILDGIGAAHFEANAVEMLRRKGDKCRFLENRTLVSLDEKSLDQNRRYRYVRGGKLTQPNYTYVPAIDELSQFGQDLDRAQRYDLIIAWAVGSTSNSNTITLVKDGKLLGNGVGQQDRVGAAELAISRARRAGHDINGAVAYSDSFFPFPDAPEMLINAGVQAIFTSAGSVNDRTVIDLCEERKVALVMVPDKTGRGLYGH